MKKQVISPDASYTFADYFKLNAEIEDVLAYFGYSYSKANLELPRTTRELEGLDNLLSRLEEGIYRVNLTSEMARREVLIAPILLQVAHYADIKVKIEYWLDVNHQLRGALDYLLPSTQSFLVVEAKNADLTKGFTQLAVELIALDKAEESETKEYLYGAVTTGDIWRFGGLDRKKKAVVESTHLFTILSDTEELVRILVGVLEQKNEN